MPQQSPRDVHALQSHDSSSAGSSQACPTLQIRAQASPEKQDVESPGYGADGDFVVSFAFACRSFY